ncbi:hypothetical protein PLESTB_000151500 [Pleodorina starrii]|uniref:BTB domain-containing protein n=1 Tax=Pleodorina starrii TaxID=330485 RepID=A0A9W6BB31_9CHLO|nr:hypothetical protein PLESTM_000450300 [Pleodorina starrii]GLC48813.1 hypothetical protein PLESTB_000151500 [Pleodorina starrii]GLC72552.1 hypothetical protein PLESTF_001264000 [Pleodorina starrii]
MDRPPAALQLAGRAPGGPAYGRPASFDPSAAGHAATVKSSHAKEYGSAFASGFLQYLRTGELADVVVEVVTDVHPDHDPPPAAAAPAQPSASAESNPASIPFLQPCPLPASSPQPSPDNSLAASPSRASSSTSPAAVSPAAAAPALSPCSRWGGWGEYRLHGLLLARHSAFFAAALGQAHFADSAARRIRLTLDPAAAPAWPTLVEYFYSDRVRLDDCNALPLLALARQLLVPELDAYCTDYVCGRLGAANCLDHLRAAVRFALHDLHSECVALAAQGFPLLYGGDLCGLPPASLLEILTHPLLQVHCELQVVEAVTRYLATTVVDSEAQRALCAQIRFAYLDNATITRLAVQPTVVLAAATGGRPAADAATAADAAADYSAAAADNGEAKDPTSSSSSSCFRTPEGVTDDAVQPAASDGAVAATRGSVAADAAQPPAGTAGSGDGAAGSSSAAAGSGESAAAPGAAGPVSSGLLQQGGEEGQEERQGQAASSSGGGSEGDGAAATAAAAAAAPGGGDSGLMSPASTSACSSPRSRSRSSGGGGGGAAAPPHAHPRLHGRHEPPRPDATAAATAAAGGSTLSAPHPPPPHHPQPHPHHHPLLPREQVLEGALARLAAMEFGTSLPLPQAFSRSSLEHAHHHPSSSSAAAAGGAAATGSGPNPASHYVNHPYLHPYQPYQFQYQYGGGAAGGGGGGAAAGAGQVAAAAAAANGGRRSLAVFRVHGGGQPQPPPPPAGGGGGGGGGPPHAHALAHGLYYNHHAAAGVGPPPLPLQPYPVHPASRGTMYGSGSGNGGGGGSRGEGDAEQQQPSGGGDPVPAAAAAGGAAFDTAAAFAAFCLPPPRLSYCCNLVHGLPGGCAWVDVALEALWEHLVPFITVQVSGCGEGSPRHVVTSDPDCFFETNDSADPLPWLEVQLPHNVHVLQLYRYTFLHGHRRAGYYRARNFKTQIAVRPASEARGPAAPPPGAGGPAAGGGAAAAAAAAAAHAQRPPGGQGQGQGGGASSSGPAAAAPPPPCRYMDLTTRMAEQFDVGVLAGATAMGPWRVMRLQATGAQEDGVHRLCVRGLRMYGIARVDLMQQANGGFVVQPHCVLNARLDQGGSGGGAAGGGGAGGGGAGGGGYGLGAGAGAAAGGGGASPYGGGTVLQQWLGWHNGA